MSLYHVAIAALLASPLPAMAQYKGISEKKWAESLNSDIRNDAPYSSICSEAMSSAAASDEIRFKEWAYGVARKYCPPEEFGEGALMNPESPSQPIATPQYEAIPEGCTLTQAQMGTIARGAPFATASGDCFMSFN